MHWFAAITPVSRATTYSMTSRYACVTAWISGRSCWKWSMCASDRPPPMGGMPWCSTNVMKESGSRSMIAKQCPVPRMSRYMTSGPTGRPAASTGTVEEYWLSIPMCPTSRAASGARVVTSWIASTTADQSSSGSCSAISPSRTVVIGRAAEATSVPFSSTSATLAFVVPTSMPSVCVTCFPLLRLRRGPLGPRSAVSTDRDRDAGPAPLMLPLLRLRRGPLGPRSAVRPTASVRGSRSAHAFGVVAHAREGS